VERNKVGGHGSVEAVCHVIQHMSESLAAL